MPQPAQSKPDRVVLTMPRNAMLPPPPPKSACPVIIGSGLTGMAISRRLSRAAIPHMLVGSPPGTLPRLGESLNLEGTLLLLEQFPDLSRFFYPKKVVVGYLAEHALTCDFALAQIPTARAILKALGYSAVPYFLQFDRLGFDAALYEVTASSEFCTAVDAKVLGLEYRAETDTFTEIRLADGRMLHPSYVFDASNHGRVLGQMTGMECTPLGEPQRVVYTHYHAPPGTRLATEEWELATLIVRLFRDTDTINAIAWCIPLGSYISVGMSMTADETDLPDETLLNLTERAFARYGVCYRDRFSHAVSVMGLRHRYFIHERAYGRNWVLAGPSYCQVWWMAGAGVGTALAAADLAPRLLQDPLRWGSRYESYMQQLLPIHETFDYFALSEWEGFVPARLHHYSDRFVITNLARLSRSTRLRASRLGAFFGPGLGWLLTRPGMIQNFCNVTRCGAVEHTGPTVAGACSATKVMEAP